MKNNNEYMVSVRLMTFNHAAYIQVAMEGIMMQKTSFPVEVVVGDDFSKDDTLEIIRKFNSTDRIHIHILDRKIGDEYWQKRQQLGRLYNFTNIISNCKGKYIALLDGDDYWTDPLKLQKQVDFLESNPAFVACFHPVKVVDSDGQELRKSKSSFLHNRDFTSEELMRGRVMSTLSLCFRNVINVFPDEYYKSPTGDNFICSLLGNFGHGKFLANVEPSAYRVHATGVWSLKDDSQKKMNLLLSYFWLWQYYTRIGKSEYSFVFYRKIILEGFYSNPFTLDRKRASFLDKSEQLMVRFVRKLYRLARRLFMKRAYLETPTEEFHHNEHA